MTMLSIWNNENNLIQMFINEDISVTISRSAKVDSREHRGGGPAVAKVTPQTKGSLGLLAATFVARKGTAPVVKPKQGLTPSANPKAASRGANHS
uniref:Uncharacterized protein n=1 Tax=Xenopus tropicalis TaxID=8364 RepID=A0A1B8Y0Y3_XENTR